MERKRISRFSIIALMGTRIDLQHFNVSQCWSWKAPKIGNLCHCVSQGNNNSPLNDQLLMGWWVETQTKILNKCILLFACGDGGGDFFKGFRAQNRCASTRESSSVWYFQRGLSLISWLHTCSASQSLPSHPLTLSVTSLCIVLYMPSLLLEWPWILHSNEWESN